MTTPLVDARVLGLLQRLPGAEGQSLATELVAAYIATAASRLDEVHVALDSGDLPSARRLAHSLRGSAAMLGATPFADLLYAAEARADSGDADGARVALELVRGAWPATADALTATAASLRDGTAAP
jgi:HPt (histidine-containing phosphotransfer) domain-containing protein